MTLLMIFPASLIVLFLDLRFIETAHSKSALIMCGVVNFFSCLFDQMVSNPVVSMVMVANKNTSSASTCSIKVIGLGTPQHTCCSLTVLCTCVEAVLVGLHLPTVTPAQGTVGRDQSVESLSAGQ